MHAGARQRAPRAAGGGAAAALGGEVRAPAGRHPGHQAAEGAAPRPPAPPAGCCAPMQRCMRRVKSTRAHAAGARRGCSDATAVVRTAASRPCAAARGSLRAAAGCGSSRDGRAAGVFLSEPRQARQSVQSATRAGSGGRWRWRARSRRRPRSLRTGGAAASARWPRCGATACASRRRCRCPRAMS